MDKCGTCHGRKNENIDFFLRSLNLLSLAKPFKIKLCNFIRTFPIQFICFVKSLIKSIPLLRIYMLISTPFRFMILFGQTRRSTSILCFCRERISSFRKVFDFYNVLPWCSFVFFVAKYLFFFGNSS